MSDPRFYISLGVPAHGDAQQEFDLPASVAHHAVRVLRLRPGDGLVLFDGRGGEYRATLAQAAASPDGGARARVLSHDPVEREARIPLVLVQSLAAHEKLDWIVEKAVEMGAIRILVAATARSSVRLDPARAARRRERWAAIAAGASEQCGRTRVPAVEWHASLDGALAALAPGGARFVLDPQATLGLQAALPVTEATLFIGPEGGYAPEEIIQLEAAGCRRVRLGPRILRTETAGIVAMATLLGGAGEFA